TVPADLAKALATEQRAGEHFEAFSKSSKKAILYWIESAKRAETRARRIAETVRLAARNKRANFDE
ncbi:MAG: YdeI/OmpD-associated family protein, partial [Pyrinomonadaceae bacterium]|nr:YdeI/OmpD-associated family protein [Pyrinomonadaceae bacterium]